MAPSLKEQFIAALAANGSQLVPSRSRKYTCMTRTAGTFYFIGKSGALRFGSTSTKSYPVSDAFKRKLLGLPTPPRTIAAQIIHDTRREKADPTGYVVTMQAHGSPPTEQFVQVGENHNGIVEYRGSFVDAEAALRAVNQYLADAGLQAYGPAGNDGTFRIAPRADIGQSELLYR